MPYPKYDFNKFLKAGAERARYLQALFNFINPELKGLDNMVQVAQVDRIRASLVQEKIECDYNEVYNALHTKNVQQNEIYHRVNAYTKAYKYIDQRFDELTLSNLKKGHEILVRNTSQEKFGGILRNITDNKDSVYELPDEDQLDNLVKVLLKHSKSKRLDKPVIHALSVYLLFDIVQPFLVQNQCFSLIFFNVAIKRMGFDLGGLLSFEKYMLRDWNTHKSIKLNSLFPINAKERMQADLTAFFENCYTIINESYLEVEDDLIGALKKSTNYENLKPIQRNSFNYFFELGFKKHYDKIGALNERQQAILRDVVFQRTVTTKQMVMKYRCDRKTVQRDFADLMEVGIVNYEGKTKTVNYHLSFA
ncbi:MAG: hypothetical protein JXQ87_18405 [Bacteroidia bacterium]